MKLLLVLFGLCASSCFATHPATNTAITKIKACLDLAADVSLAGNVYAVVDVLGLLNLNLQANLKCVDIGAYVALGTEISYSETIVGTTVTADVNLEVCVDVDLISNANVYVTLLGSLVKIAIGVCDLTIRVDLDLDLVLEFEVGDESNCKIKQIDHNCTRKNCSVGNSGNAIIDRCKAGKSTDICDDTYNKWNTALGNTLLGAIDP
ncbi:uncharacterized protein [Onthophagus taurus]|uniref:uncharacterized protein n=1 Tax=Onthophagus taurus TaxID=166361 RepID=UPI0039BE2F60